MNYARNYREAYETNRTVVNICHDMILIGRKAPIEGWVKLNMDGSCRVKLNTNGSCRENGRAGRGGIIRGSDSEGLGGFAKSIGVCSAYMVELWGLYEGLRYARILGFQAIELNVDSLVVVNARTQNERGSPMGRSLVEKIRRMIDLEWEVVVKHSYFEANQCADALANYGCSLSGDISFFESRPTQFGHLLTAVVMGLSIPHLILV